MEMVNSFLPFFQQTREQIRRLFVCYGKKYVEKGYESRYFMYENNLLGV